MLHAEHTQAERESDKASAGDIGKDGNTSDAGEDGDAGDGGDGGEYDESGSMTVTELSGEEEIEELEDIDDSEEDTNGPCSKKHRHNQVYRFSPIYMYHSVLGKRQPSRVSTHVPHFKASM